MNLRFASKVCRASATVSIFRPPVLLFIASVFLSTAPQGCLKEPTLKSLNDRIHDECDRRADAALQNGAYMRSIEMHQQFLAEHPGHAMALYHLGYAFGRSGNEEKEIEYYEKSLSSGCNKNHLFFNLGMAYGETQRYHEALRTFRMGLVLYPDNLDLRFGLATTLEAMGQFDKAVNQLRKILVMDPGHQIAKEMLKRIQQNRQEN